MQHRPLPSDASVVSSLPTGALTHQTSSKLQRQQKPENIFPLLKVLALIYRWVELRTVTEAMRMKVKHYLRVFLRAVEDDT